ncbi:hypothetical protein C789_2818 [Microcystis aeruginosa FACHB-905 = DIANCHI905]|nr:hypothetical protein C789_2818 [Microcystis aeruginosa FACHB-905 = DIANCHI905]
MIGDYLVEYLVLLPWGNRVPPPPFTPHPTPHTGEKIKIIS